MLGDNLSLPLGLTVTQDFSGRIADEHYNELEKQRIKQGQVAKAKLFEDDTDYTNAINAYDNPRIKEAANAKIRELGKYVSTNPSWETDPMKRAEVKRYKTDLKNLSVVGIQSDTQRKEMQKDMATAAKNPETFNTDAWKAIQDQWANYEKTGHQLGEEGFGREGHKAFVYTQPNDKINYLKRTQELSAGLEKVMTDKKLSNGDVVSEVNPNAINQVAQGLYNEDRYQADKEAVKAGYPDGLSFIQSLINTGKKINPNRSQGFGGNQTPYTNKINLTITRGDNGELLNADPQYKGGQNAKGRTIIPVDGVDTEVEVTNAKGTPENPTVTVKNPLAKKYNEDAETDFRKSLAHYREEDLKFKDELKKDFTTPPDVNKNATDAQEYYERISNWHKANPFPIKPKLLTEEKTLAGDEANRAWNNAYSMDLPSMLAGQVPGHVEVFNSKENKSGGQSAPAKSGAKKNIPAPKGLTTVIQKGHTYTWNSKTGQYE